MLDLPAKATTRVNVSLSVCKEHVDNWRQSNLSMAEYSKLHNIHESSLPRWRRRLLKSSRPEESSGFTKVVTGNLPSYNHNNIQTQQIELMLPNNIKLKLSNISNIAEISSLIQELIKCS